MFRLNDHALTESEIGLFESAAFVSPNGFIQFQGQSRKNERSQFNLCEILLEWSTAEQYGVQRIRLGNDKPLTRERWRRKLLTRVSKTQTLYSAVIATRKVSVRLCFPADKLKFRVLGWRLMSVKFWTPGRSVRIEEAAEARITHVRVPCLEESTFLPGAKPR